MDRIEALRTFAQVAEFGSFTEAAARGAITPAQVSKRIAWLEAEYATRLFDRTTRQVALTPAGLAALEDVKTVLDSLERLDQQMRADQTEMAGLLRISAPVTFATTHLMGPLIDFMKLHPRIDVRLVLSDRRVDLIEDGFDLAVRIGPLEDSSLIARKLGMAPVALVACPDIALQVPKDAGPDILSAWPAIIDLNFPTPQRWTLYGPKEAQVSIKIAGRFTVNNPEASRAAAIAGLGIAAIPEFALVEDLASARLVRVLPDWAMAARPIHALIPQNRFVAPRVRALIDHLVARL